MIARQGDVRDWNFTHRDEVIIDYKTERECGNIIAHIFQFHMPVIKMHFKG